MDTIKQLTEQLKKARAEMKTLRDAIQEAEGDEAVAKASEAFEAKRDEAMNLKAKLDDAIAEEEQEKALDASINAGDAAKPRTKKQAALGGTDAQPRDQYKEMREKEQCFVKYMEGGRSSMSPREYEAIKADDSQTRSEQSTGAVKLPRALTLSMFGLKWALGVGYSKSEIAAILKQSTMTSDVANLGGDTVPEDFRLPMLSVPTEAAHILPRATVVPAPTGEVTYPKALQTDNNEYGGMTGSWIGEAGLKPKTDTQFEQVKIQTHEFAMHTQISHRLLSRSAVAMEQWVATTGRNVAMDAMDKAFINGDGNGKPLGILQTNGIRNVGRQVAGTVGRTDLLNLKYALKPYHRANGTYLMEDGVLQKFEELEDNEGRPLFTANTATGVFERLAGFPFITNTRQPTLGSVGDLCFVDLSQYYVAMEQDIMVKRSDDYDIVHNVATIVMFVVVGGKLVEPRVCGRLAAVGAS